MKGKLRKKIALLLSIVMLLNLFQLSVFAIDQPINIEQQIEGLQRYYESTKLTTPLGVVGMRSIVGDEEIEERICDIPYYGNSGYYNLGVIFTGAADGIAAIDQMMLGKNPRDYEKITAGTTHAEKHDLIEAIFAKMDEDGTFNHSTEKMVGIVSGKESTNIHNILALEMFYNGSNWEKEGGGEKQNRRGAIEAFLSLFFDAQYPKKSTQDLDMQVTTGAMLQITTSSIWQVITSQSLTLTPLWKVEGGRIYEEPSIVGMLPYRIGSYCDAITLLTRWLDDKTLVTINGETEVLKDVAKREIEGLMRTVNAIYKKEINGLTTSHDANIFSLKHIGAYISASVAADQINYISELGLWERIKEKQQSDGGYNSHKNEANKLSNPLDTARIAIGLGDYLRGESILATFVFDSNMGAMDAVTRDLENIKLPSIVRETVKLPNKGVYGSTIEWTSSNEEIVNPLNGEITPPLKGESEIGVKLTATATYETVSKVKEFYVIVPPEYSNDQVIVNEFIKNLKIPLFVNDKKVSLPTEGKEGIAVLWSSSDEGIIDSEGNVTQTNKEQKVVLTARVKCNEAGYGEKEFPVTVGAINTEDIVASAVNQVREYYDRTRDLSGGYWDVWAAKAVFGDDFEKYDFELYNVKNHRVSSAWKGTDYGGVILQILAQGDNPYNYQGINYVENMLRYIDSVGNEPYWGMFGEPIFLTMALDATGEMTPELYQSVRGMLRGQLYNLNYGPDLAGWSMVPLMTHLEDDVVFKEQLLTSLDDFRAQMIGYIMRDKKDPNYGLIVTKDIAGYLHELSTNCVLLGTVAAQKAGLGGFDVTEGEWPLEDGSNIIDAIYKRTFVDKNGKEKEGPYNVQIAIAFGDLYYGENVWASVGIKHEQLIGLLQKVQSIVEGDSQAYTQKTLDILKAAYEEAKVYEGQKYGFGEAYFTLRDAYEGLKPAGSTSIQILGNAGREVLLETTYVDSNGSYLDILIQAAKDNRFSQTIKQNEVYEIGGVSITEGAAWYCYDDQDRILDLTQLPEEGADITFKYCIDTKALDESATLEEHLVYDATQLLTIKGAIDENNYVTGDLELQASGIFGTTVSWLPDKTFAISDTGKVTRDRFEDIKVKLVATVSGSKGAAKTKTFEVVVKALEGQVNPEPSTKTAYISVIDPKDKTYFSKAALPIESGETAFSLLEKTGLSLDVDKNTQYGVYVAGIEGLSEFDHGEGSGWMYRVNGIFPSHSAAYERIDKDDYVEWIYTRNYGKDIGGHLAVDGSDGDPNAVEVSADGHAVILRPEVSISDQVALVTLTDSEVDKAIQVIKANNANELVIAPSINENIVKMVVNLSKSAITKLVQDTNAVVTVILTDKRMSISKEVLTSIMNTSGLNVSMSVEKIDTSKLTYFNQKIVGNKVGFGFKIQVGKKVISDFKGKVEISLPYTLSKDEHASSLVIYYVDKEGNVTKVPEAKYNREKSSVIFKTDSLGTFVIGYEESKWPFMDVKDSDWFYPAVQFALENGLFEGLSETTFGPNEHMTRGMLVTVLYRMEGNPVVSTTNTFSDIDKEAWYAEPIAWAAANHIISGYPDGRFRAEESISREQITTILYRYAQSKDYEISITSDMRQYADESDLSGYAATSVKWAVANKILNGRTEAMLVPKGTATRGEVATVLMRFVENISK